MFRLIFSRYIRLEKSQVSLLLIIFPAIAWLFFYPLRFYFSYCLLTVITIGNVFHSISQQLNCTTERQIIRYIYLLTISGQLWRNWHHRRGNVFRLRTSAAH